MRFTLLIAAVVILVRDPTGKWANDPLQPWFESLRNKLGLYCCAKADGHVLDDGEWDTKDNNYRVFVQGRWVVVPGDAVLSGPNKFGKAIVWFRNYPWRLPPDPPTLSFLPGWGFCSPSPAMEMTAADARPPLSAAVVCRRTLTQIKAGSGSPWLYGVASGLWTFLPEAAP